MVKGLRGKKKRIQSRTSTVIALEKIRISNFTNIPAVRRLYLTQVRPARFPFLPLSSPATATTLPRGKHNPTLYRGGRRGGTCERGLSRRWEAKVIKENTTQVCPIPYPQENSAQKIWRHVKHSYQWLHEAPYVKRTHVRLLCESSRKTKYIKKTLHKQSRAWNRIPTKNPLGNTTTDYIQTQHRPDNARPAPPLPSPARTPTRHQAYRRRYELVTFQSAIGRNNILGAGHTACVLGRSTSVFLSSKYSRCHRV